MSPYKLKSLAQVKIISYRRNTRESTDRIFMSSDNREILVIIFDIIRNVQLNRVILLGN